MSRLQFGLLLATLAAACAAPALVPAKPARGTQYAFLVGCGNYRKSEFRALPFTGNDVLRFRDALLQTGFEPAGVLVLHDGARSSRFLPERAKILEELDLLLEGMQSEDTLVVALSGHGVQFKGDPVSYFVPVDGKVSDKRTLIALDGKGGLYEKLRACRAKKKLLVVNACRNDPTASLDFATTKAELVDEDREEVPEGIAAIYSCAAGQKSYYDPDRKIALFYEHLAKAWQGAYGSGGAVSLEDVFKQVTVKTKLDALQNFQVKQTPVVRRDYRGEWVITVARPPAKAPPAKVSKVPPETGLVAEMKFVHVPQGTFWMGWDSLKKQSKLTTVAHDFEMAGLCVTQAQWQAIMGNNPSWFSRQGKGKDAVAKVADADLARFPVEMISWEEAQEFIRRLNARESGKGWTYRLPTEAEWEYACRGAAQSKEECSYDYYLPAGTNEFLARQGNFVLGRTTKVGSYPPNRLGLYDMHGNVWQWCADVFDGKSDHRAKRGGSYYMKAVFCRAGWREGAPPGSRWTDTGLRLARSPAPPPDTGLVAEMKFVRVPDGTFWMGGRYLDEKERQWKPGPQKQVNVGHDFEIAAYCVTQGQWRDVMGNNPSAFSRQHNGWERERVKDVPDAELARFPVENVSWHDVQKFLQKLNAREAGKGWVYRLPTEVEWEYACRNASQGKDECAFSYYFQTGTNDLSSTQANFNGNFPAGKGAKGPFLSRTTKVGSYAPNKLGLFDMHGNVWQWCADVHDGGKIRVYRGGAWHNRGDACCVVEPNRVRPTSHGNAVGFRLARVPAWLP